MNDLKLEDRLLRNEQLLAANKEVLTLKEACDYTGISRSYMRNIPEIRILLIKIIFWGNFYINYLNQTIRKATHHLSFHFAKSAFQIKRFIKLVLNMIQKAFWRKSTYPILKTTNGNFSFDINNYLVNPPLANGIYMVNWHIIFV